MQKIFVRILCLVLVGVLLLSLAVTAFAAEENSSVTVLFTHDLHSHLLPAMGEDGEEYGGYARLMTAIERQRQIDPNAILVDAGDFSMGSLFQTGFASSAIELRMMGAMGYDATTFGNHEFDYLPEGLAAMLRTAALCGDAVPAIVDANYLPPQEGEAGFTSASADMWDALNTYGVQDYRILERGGIYYVLFGLIGFDSDDCAPNSGMVLEDPAVIAQQVVDAARGECREKYDAEPIVIALSHSGTSEGEGEDYALAKKVSGIHLIISGHTHTTLQKPIQVNDTWIVSAGEYGKFLGVVKMNYDSGGKTALADYSLIPINESIPEDPRIAALAEGFKKDVEECYLSDYGMTFDQVLTQNPFPFDTVRDVYAYAHESTLGNVFSDAYQWAAEKALGKDVALALTASGVIRESIPMGDVTVSHIFNAASLGVGTEGELAAVYLTGEDLRNALEVDASVYPLMNSAQLFMSGVEYSFNTNRMIFNKVDHAMLRKNDGTLEAIENDRLYLVVCGMYMGQMLGSVEETSFGLLSITPRTEDGQPIPAAELENYVVRDEQGIPLKEWYAIASYLEEMGGTMDPRYEQTDGRKVVYSSLNPADLLRSANKFTYVALAILLLLVASAALIVRTILRKNQKNK